MSYWAIGIAGALLGAALVLILDRGRR